mmetsp:Transcript_39620/g.112354  ORF Transcript_39620/g.112354 Transcript_39620/m.112354 type:complete len:348 (-) Transcript_39620:890-1933(-)
MSSLLPPALGEESRPPPPPLLAGAFPLGRLVSGSKCLSEKEGSEVCRAGQPPGGELRPLARQSLMTSLSRDLDLDREVEREREGECEGRSPRRYDSSKESLPMCRDSLESRSRRCSRSRDLSCFLGDKSSGISPASSSAASRPRLPDVGFPLPPLERLGCRCPTGTLGEAAEGLTEAPAPPEEAEAFAAVADCDFRGERSRVPAGASSPGADEAGAGLSWRRSSRQAASCSSRLERISSTAASTLWLRSSCGGGSSARGGRPRVRLTASSRCHSEERRPVSCSSCILIMAARNSTAPFSAWISSSCRWRRCSCGAMGRLLGGQGGGLGCPGGGAGGRTTAPPPTYCC